MTREETLLALLEEHTRAMRRIAWAYAGAAGEEEDLKTIRPLREDLESWLAELAAFDHDGAPDAEPEGGTAC